MKNIKKLMTKLDAVVRKKGLAGVVKILIAKSQLLMNSASIIYGFKKNNFGIAFPFDGNTTVYVPKFGYLAPITQFKNYANIVNFSKRTNSEPLLRQIIWKLYQYDYISTNSSIVDIGAWIGDNAILWSKMIEDKTKNSVVFAIDPSNLNLEFINKVARENSIENLQTIQTVCSDVAGLNMSFSGSIDHAAFSKNSHRYNSGMKSTTLDILVDKTVIGFMHLDVEGHEFEVLKGAKNIILRDNPVVAFEQHLESENPLDIINWLSERGYSAFVINELLEENKPDCRNFIAFPRDFPVEKFKEQLLLCTIHSVSPANDKSSYLDVAPNG